MSGPAPAPPQASLDARAALGRRHGVTIAGLALILIGAVSRLLIAANELSTPLIDENEVVEQAVAFLGGDLEQHFVKYGPLTMYVLTGIYRVAAALHGLSVLDYASRVFFQGEEHYFIARALTSLSLSVLALVALLHFRRAIGARAALMAAALLGLPCVDVLVTGARIDMPQAAFQGLSLLALGAAAASGSHRAWLGAGVAAGLAIASKPLPGLLIAPCFPLASWFAVQRAAGGEPRRWAARLGMALAHPGLWIATSAAVAAALIADPAILDLGEFIESQRAAVALHAGPLSSGPSIVTSFGLLGVPFCALLLASFALVLVQGSPPARLVALFLAVYVAAFWGRSRHYFLVAAAVAACLLVAHGVAAAEPLLARGSERASVWFRRALPALAIVLVLPPLWRLEERTARPSAAREARDWIHANIPSGTRLYYVGWRGAGPPLVAHEASAQAKFGDHFGYGREHYAFLKQAFERGYANYADSNAPRYVIAQHHSKPLARSSKKMPRSITDGLLKTARAQKRPYIIVAGHEQPDVQALGYTWFKQAVLEREFGKIAIFRVPDEGVARDGGGAAR
jgi:4-amino-4-deoxy-L-arabinose transferase-like glycosyltransferase